jgi:hypothetical protein
MFQIGTDIAHFVGISLREGLFARTIFRRTEGPDPFPAQPLDKDRQWTAQFCTGRRVSPP